MATDVMLDLVRRVAEARREAATTNEAVKAARAAWEETYADLLALQRDEKQAVERAEAELRALAVATYETTRNKAPAPGVAIRVSTQLVYDEAHALTWARETGLALIPESVDRRALEKIAKATPLPFVSYEEEASATLAKDLDAVLAELVAPALATPEAVTTDTTDADREPPF